MRHVDQFDPVTGLQITEVTQAEFDALPECTEADLRLTSRNLWRVGEKRRGVVLIYCKRLRARKPWPFYGRRRLIVVAEQRA